MRDEVGGVGFIQDYLADAGAAAGTNALPSPQLYPLALPQSFTTLSVNVLGVLPAGQSLDVEVFRDGAPLPGSPLKITYNPGGTGLKFVVAAPQLFNGAGAPVSSQLDISCTSKVADPQQAIVPIQLTVVLG